MLNPITVLNQSVGKHVIVELRGQREYRGIMDGYDPHMNLVLKTAEEYIEGELRRKLDKVIIRGDTVIYISP